MQQINLRFHSLHVRSEKRLINYKELLEALRTAETREIEVSSDYTVVLERARWADEETLELVFLGGDQNAATVFFDREEGGAIVEPNSEQRWTAKPTRAVISLGGDERIVALESSRGGVTPLLFQRYLERIHLPGSPSRTVDITPLASESFINEIDEFERIRVASVEVDRPNYDWSDHANKLYKLADDSDAQSSTAEVKAPRGGSLNKRDGLVQVIREVASAANSSIRNAKITGRKPGDTNDQTVSLEKHQERASTGIDKSLPLDQQNTSLLESFREHIQRLRDRRNDTEA